MTNDPIRHGQPLLVIGAVGFAAVALPTLIGHEIRSGFSGSLALAAVLAAACLGAGLHWGLKLGRRLGADGAPGDKLAPVMGWLAVSLPAALLLSRLGNGLAHVFLGFSPLAGLALDLLAGMLPLGLALGTAGTLAVAAARQDEPGHPGKTRLYAIGGAVLGALFVGLVALPKLSPLNAGLDMGLGCAALGIISAAAAPSGNRRHELWLSLLAVGLILLLPLSGLIDAKTSSWRLPDVLTAPTPAAPPAPAAPIVPLFPPVQTPPAGS